MTHYQTKFHHAVRERLENLHPQAWAGFQEAGTLEAWVGEVEGQVADLAEEVAAEESARRGLGKAEGSLNRMQIAQAVQRVATEVALESLIPSNPDIQTTESPPML